MKLKNQLKQQLEELEDSIANLAIASNEWGLCDDKEYDSYMSSVIDECTKLHILLKEII